MGSDDTKHFLEKSFQDPNEPNHKFFVEIANSVIK